MRIRRDDRAGYLRAYRGPLILALVSGGLLIPNRSMLLPLLSRPYVWQSILYVVLFSLGFLVCIRDVCYWIHQEIRFFVRTKIEEISLDDLLKGAQETENNLFVSMVGSVLGPMIMFGLPGWTTTEEQRIRLVQSGLEVTDINQARRILLDPGGWKYLLPNNLQKWIFNTAPSPDPSSTTERTAIPLISSAPAVDATASPQPDSDLESHNSFSLSDASEVYEIEKQRVKEKAFVKEVNSLIGVEPKEEDENRTCEQSTTMIIPTHSYDNDASQFVQEGTAATTTNTAHNNVRKSNHSSPPLSSPTPLNVVLGSILQEMITERFARYLPYSLLENDEKNKNYTLELSSAAASVALLGHLLGSPRSREMLRNILAGVTMAGLTTAWITSVTLLLAKHRQKLVALLETKKSSSSSSSSNPQNPASLVIVFSKILQHWNPVWKKIVATGGRHAKWKGFLAALVLFHYFGVRQRLKRKIATH